MDEVHLFDELDSLIGRADIIALCLPATPQTYHILDERRLKEVKDDAVILNIGRGNCIDCTALKNELLDGRFTGVGLDVTEPEPLDPSDDLWDMPRTIITPHVAGKSHASLTLVTKVQIAADNLKAYFNGQPLRNEVDFSTGYRKAESKR